MIGPGIYKTVHYEPGDTSSRPRNNTSIFHRFSDTHTSLFIPLSLSLHSFGMSSPPPLCPLMALLTWVGQREQTHTRLARNRGRVLSGLVYRWKQNNVGADGAGFFHWLELHPELEEAHRLMEWYFGALEKVHEKAIVAFVRANPDGPKHTVFAQGQTTPVMSGDEVSPDTFPGKYIPYTCSNRSGAMRIFTAWVEGKVMFSASIVTPKRSRPRASVEQV
jgi:hypothetical protein